MLTITCSTGEHDRSRTSNGQTIFVADAHLGDGQRFVVRADEKLTAFVELESQLAVKGIAF
jgi:hypothetical protein